MARPHSLKHLIYVLPEPVDDELICTICHEPLLDPVVEPGCRQMFCRDCLAEWLGRSGSCPHCRQAAPIRDVVPPPRFISNILDALHVVCPTCRGHIERNQLISHGEKCLQPCKLGCGRPIAPIDVDTHSAACPAKMLACPAADVGCEMTAARSELGEHTKHCPLLPMRSLLQRVQALEKSSRTQAQMITKLQEENRMLRHEKAGWAKPHRPLVLQLEHGTVAAVVLEPPPEQQTEVLIHVFLGYRLYGGNAALTVETREPQGGGRYFFKAYSGSDSNHSQCFWLPITSEYKVHATQTGSATYNGGHGRMEILAYR